MNEQDRKSVQNKLNRFTNRYVKGFKPLVVDGDFGPATEDRIRRVKYFLGNNAPNGPSVTNDLIKKLNHPRRVSSFRTKKQFKTSKKRCRRQRLRWIKENVYAFVSPGVVRFEGTPVARWFIPYLEFARKHNWNGGVNSGWRSPAYSEQLCYQICGAPTCAGRCAGRNTNHAKKDKPNGAIDVSDPATFANIMNRSDAPQPRIYNALGAADPWHFSTTGR